MTPKNNIQMNKDNSSEPLKLINKLMQDDDRSDSEHNTPKSQNFLKEENQNGLILSGLTNKITKPYNSDEISNFNDQTVQRKLYNVDLMEFSSLLCGKNRVDP